MFEGSVIKVGVDSHWGPAVLTGQVEALENDPEVQKYCLQHSYDEISAAYDEVANNKNIREGKPPIEKGVLQATYEHRAVTTHREDIKQAFLDDREHGDLAKFAELLPLLANAKGRLGEYISVDISKTFTGDDRGNDFVDLTIRLTNDYIKENSGNDPRFKDMRPSISICVDVTTNIKGLEEKNYNTEARILSENRRAEALCYKDAKLGDLGFRAPKVVIYQDGDELAKISAEMSQFTSASGKGLSIINPEEFNKVYRSYFQKLLATIEVSASSNAGFLSGDRLNPEEESTMNKDRKRIRDAHAAKLSDKVFREKALALRDAYVHIINFIEILEQTPIKKEKTLT